MNTPAHAILGLALLGSGPGRRHTLPIAVGSVLPDLPMFGFYLWQRWVLSTPERDIWGDAYFQPGWQDLFDVFNSIPIALLGLLICRLCGARAAAWLFAGMLLHQLGDLPLHGNDAHRHFLPFSDWRFMSPVSYWDPAHGGAVAALGEVGILFVGGAVLWRRFPHPLARAICSALAALQVAGWVWFYGLGRAPV